MVTVGLERLAKTPRRWVNDTARVGLLCNPASIDRDFRSARDVVTAALPGQLTCLFGPQHGVQADVQDNMVETDHGHDPELDIPVWSLYGEVRKPTPQMLKEIDLLLVDIQDVGTRVYTFIWTLRLVMEACGEAGVKVIVLDRPNPIGGEGVEGNLLDPSLRSFVGWEPIPMRHAMTVGELARWFRDYCKVDCELEVVEMQGWQREMLWHDTGRPWVMPSPNMPTVETALVYPGTVLLEGTTASEGRGTTRPFELVGGPWGLETRGPDALAAAMNRRGLDGVFFRPVTFEPTSQKWTRRSCHGLQIHVTDPLTFRPYQTGLSLLSSLWKLFHADGFGWRQPPYEYEETLLPIHLLLGDRGLREGVEQGVDPLELEQSWAEPLNGWLEERRACLVY
jgi:uncharacterized protein YbbC (DUF1343 family)